MTYLESQFPWLESKLGGLLDKVESIVDSVDVCSLLQLCVEEEEDNRLVNDPELIRTVNESQRSWVAGVNHKFHGHTYSDVKR